MNGKVVRSLSNTVVAVWAVGCGIYVAPAHVGTPTINTAVVQRELFATVETLTRNYPTYVFSITPTAAGFEVGTSSSVQTLDRSGRVLDVRRLEIPDRDVVFPLMRNRGADPATIFAGEAKRSLVIFDEAGRRLGEAPLCYPTDLLVADVAEDSQPEVICAGGAIGKTLRIHRTDGSLLRTIELGETVAGLAALDATGDGKDEIIAYTYPSGKGIARFRVLGDDRVVADWKLPAACRFSVVETDEGHALVVKEDSAFVVRNLGGEILHRFEDPSLSASGFCRPMGAQLPDGSWFFVASGKGGFNYHLVAYFSGDELQFSETRSGISHAMLPVVDEKGGAVLVGSGPEIWKYSVP